MGKRLNIERQNELEPIRMNYCKDQLFKLGFEITYEDKTRIEFIYNNEIVKMFPYSGWHTGKSIEDGRGIEKLLKQLRKSPNTAPHKQ